MLSIMAKSSARFAIECKSFQRLGRFVMAQPAEINDSPEGIRPMLIAPFSVNCN